MSAHDDTVSLVSETSDGGEVQFRASHSFDRVEISIKVGERVNTIDMDRATACDFLARVILRLRDLPPVRVEPTDEKASE